MGEVAGGDKRAIAVERHITGGAAVAAWPPEGKRGRQVAAG